MDCTRKHGRYGDCGMILLAYRHGLRASEVCDLQGQQIELSEGRLYVHRVKNGIASVHPIRGDEMRALRKLPREYPKEATCSFPSRGGPNQSRPGSLWRAQQYSAQRTVRFTRKMAFHAMLPRSGA